MKKHILWILGIIVVLIAITTWHYTVNTPEQITPDTFEQTAVEKITALPEVQEWKKLMEEKSPGHAVITFDSKKDNIYTVHVYEDLPDHTATFNWYDVDKDTGDVTPLFPIDSMEDVKMMN